MSKEGLVGVAFDAGDGAESPATVVGGLFDDGDGVGSSVATVVISAVGLVSDVRLSSGDPDFPRSSSASQFVVSDADIVGPNVLGFS